MTRHRWPDSLKHSPLVTNSKTREASRKTNKDGKLSMTAITLNTEPRTASRGSHTPEWGDARTIDAAGAASHVYIPSDGRIVKALVELARAAKSHRIIVAGSNCSEVFLELRQLGYSRVATTKTCRIPCTQHDVALLAWREHSIKALATTLDWLVHFLNPGGVLVVWLKPHERMPNRKLRAAMEGLGFRIEAGARCENGVAISARRLESTPAAKAALRLNYDDRRMHYSVSAPRLLSLPHRERQIQR
jgi:hypothetical protein